MIKTLTLKVAETKPMSYTEQELYWDYKNELWKMTGEQYSDKEVWAWYLDILRCETYIIRIIDTLKTPEQIGFVFIGVGEACPKDADYYIWDCYIEPAYRRQHIMENTIQDFIKGHTGSYALYLIDNNEPAVKFWEKQFSTLKYKESVLIDILDIEEEHCKPHKFVYCGEKGD